MIAKFNAIAGCAALVLWAACATPGPPQPPSLGLPQPVSDLEAAREGDRVILTWSAPALTTDKLRIRERGATAICRHIVSSVTTAQLDTAAVTDCEPVIATAAPGDVKPESAAAQKLSLGGPAPAPRVSYSFALAPALIQQHPEGAAIFYIEPLNARGRGAGFSNGAVVPLAPAYLPPQGLRAEQSKTAVILSWTPVAVTPTDNARLAGYRLERSERAKEASSAAATWAPNERLFIASGSPSDGRLLDTQFAWDKEYRYRIASVTRVFSADGRQLAEVQGEWSQPTEVATKDLFPPAAPTGLQAVFTEAQQQRFIDLTWLPSTEPDIGGYVVYRRSEGSEPQRITPEPVKAPAFRDTNVQPGTRYSYSVSAVDLRGNESARSQEASEVVPPN